MKFQNIVVMVAVVILILLLTWVGYGMYQHQINARFPPVSSECPDYWKAKDGKCINIKHLGNCNVGPNNNTVDFNSPHFKGDDAICRKASWARRCQVTWNGITNAGATLQEKCGQE